MICLHGISERVIVEALLGISAMKLSQASAFAAKLDAEQIKNARGDPKGEFVNNTTLRFDLT